MEVNPYESPREVKPTLSLGFGQIRFSAVDAVLVLVLPVVGSIAGYLAVSIPWEMAVASGATKAKNMIDGMQPIPLLLLALIGFMFGLISPRWFWIGAFSQFAAFPAIAFWEMHNDPTSHNLWPLEFIIYGIMGAICASIGLAGSFIGRPFIRYIWRISYREELSI
jgi:hypothetical protein